MDAVRDATLSGVEVKTTDMKPIPADLTRSEILYEQTGDDFCHNVLSPQLWPKKLIFEDYDGALCRIHPLQPDLIQVVLPSSLRARVLWHAHYYPLWVTSGIHRRVFRVV